MPSSYLRADNLHSVLGAEPLVRRKVMLHNEGVGYTSTGNTVHFFGVWCIRKTPARASSLLRGFGTAPLVWCTVRRVCIVMYIHRLHSPGDHAITLCELLVPKIERDTHLIVDRFKHNRFVRSTPHSIAPEHCSSQTLRAEV